MKRRQGREREQSLMLEGALNAEHHTDPYCSAALFIRSIGAVAHRAVIRLHLAVIIVIAFFLAIAWKL